MTRSKTRGRFEVVVSPAAADRLAAAAAFVHGFPANTEVLLVGATREAVDDLVRGLARDGTATFGLHRFTLLQLASRLAAPELTRSGLAPLTPLGAISLAARITFEGVRDGRVTYFAPVARCPGFARALAATLAELRLGGVRPDALRGLSPAGDDLAALLSLYEEQMGAAALADRALLLDLAASAARPRAGAAADADAAIGRSRCARRRSARCSPPSAAPPATSSPRCRAATARPLPHFPISARCGMPRRRRASRPPA